MEMSIKKGGNIGAYRSRHCFPIRAPSSEAIIDQRFGPYWCTSCRCLSSSYDTRAEFRRWDVARDTRSSLVHGPLTMRASTPRLICRSLLIDVSIRCRASAPRTPKWQQPSLTRREIKPTTLVRTPAPETRCLLNVAIDATLATRTRSHTHQHARVAGPSRKSVVSGEHGGKVCKETNFQREQKKGAKNFGARLDHCQPRATFLMTMKNRRSKNTLIVVIDRKHGEPTTTQPLPPKFSVFVVVV